MKAGDLVKFDECYYPQYRGELGLLVRKRKAEVVGCCDQGCYSKDTEWEVWVKGRVHPFFVDEEEMQVVIRSNNWK
tara:strand:- start:561 stop:788 length:228 start_codon:yes stop_codon:yes gene_type:complete